jgi:transposase
MLRDQPSVPLSPLDEQVFALVVPEDHYLRQVRHHIDFERFRLRLSEPYSPDQGRPSIDPVRMLKILFLCFHYKLSDHAVLARAATDMAFRWFLDLGLQEDLPHPTCATYFRKRIGDERFTQVFQELVTVAREKGLVRDRLRLKDATHLFAAAADLTPLAVAAQVRDRLLRAAQPLFPDWVAGQRTQLDTLRQTTAEYPNDQRLAARVEYLTQITAQLRTLIAALPAVAEDPTRTRLDNALVLADKLLADHADPKAGDRLVNGVDPQARTGWHHEFFLGYLLDVAIDADSEIITGVNVLPGNGAEAADAIELIRQEEAAQGNDVAELSLDGAGNNGPVLRQLHDPSGLNLVVTAPPAEPAATTTFGPERFELKVLADGCGEVSCPAGQVTRTRVEHEHGYRYFFTPRQCRNCSLRGECLQNPSSTKGRSVIKNEYEVEYRRLAARSLTAEYEATRRVHPRIERKLGEMVRHHGCRWARYRGRVKVLVQSLLTALVVNVKRIVKLCTQKLPTSTPTQPVRAELALG